MADSRASMHSSVRQYTHTLSGTWLSSSLRIVEIGHHPNSLPFCECMYVRIACGILDALCRCVSPTPLEYAFSCGVHHYGICFADILLCCFLCAGTAFYAETWTILLTWGTTHNALPLRCPSKGKMFSQQTSQTTTSTSRFQELPQEAVRLGREEQPVGVQRLHHLSPRLPPRTR